MILETSTIRAACICQVDRDHEARSQGGVCLAEHQLMGGIANKSADILLPFPCQTSNSKRSGTPFSQIQRFSKSCKGSPIPLPLWT